MTDRKYNRLFGSSPRITGALIIYIVVGSMLLKLIKDFWPDHLAHGLWILIAVGMAGYFFDLWRHRDRGS